MWTLRDLWHFFDEEEKQRWLQEQARKMSTGKQDTDMNLRNLLQRKNQIIENVVPPDKRNPAEMYLRDMYSPPYKKQYKGLI